MNRTPAPRHRDIHLIDCDCPECEALGRAPVPGLYDDLADVALRFNAGILLGLVIAQAIAWATGGPNVLQTLAGLS